MEDKLLETIRRKSQYIDILKREKKQISHERDAWEKKCNELYATARATSPGAAIIRHLEKEISVRDNILEKYQEHYSHYGKFYKVLEVREGHHKADPVLVEREGVL